MRTFIYSAAILAASATCAISQARPPLMMGQAPCADTAYVKERLATEYKESVHSRGITESGYLVEIWRAETGSWTVVVTTPDGRSCFPLAGQSFDVIDEAFPVSLGPEL